MVNIADLRKKNKKEAKKKEAIVIEEKEIKKEIEEIKKEIKSDLKIPEKEKTSKKIEIETEEEKELFLCFSIGRELYGIQIDYIQEIIPLYPMTKVPNAPPEVMGIISIRGLVLPVLNIGIFLGQKIGNITEDTRLIILKIKEEILSIIVDKVYQNISIPLKKIESAPSTVKDEKGLIAGVYLFKKQLLILLKAEQI